VDVLIDRAKYPETAQFEVVVEDKQASLRGVCAIGKGTLVISRPMLVAPSEPEGPASVASPGPAPSKTFADLPVPWASVPVVRASGSYSGELLDGGGATVLGKLEGKAWEKGYQMLVMDLPAPMGSKVRAEVRCEEEGLSVQNVRSAGNRVEVMVCVDARKSFTTPFHVRLEGGGKVVEGSGQVVIARADPVVFGLQTLCGGTTRGSPPVKAELPEDREFSAWFEPNVKEFSLSQSRGIIEAGARVLPFEVIYAPVDAKPVDTVLIVEAHGMEIVIQVCGSVGGFQGRKWGERRTRGGG
jgi:hypothetical protein